MKKLILIVALLSSTSYAKTQYRYVPKASKNFFSLMLGAGPVGMGYAGHRTEEEITLRSYNQVDESLVVNVKTKMGPIYGAQYIRMFNKNFGGNLGFMSNSSAFAGITIGW